MEKKSYKPANRRFEISADGYSRERIRVLREVFSNLSRDVPEVRFALALFGSLSKGKFLDEEIAEVSDVDLYVFFDSSDVIAHSEELRRKYDFYAKCEDSVIGKLPKIVVWEDLQVPAKTMASIKAMDLLVGGYVKHEIEDNLEIKNNDVFTRPISESGPDSIYKHVRRLFFADESEKWTEDYRGLRESIARPWHLDVGGGLRKYRQNFLLKLARLEPAVAGEFWRLVNICVREAERNYFIPKFAEVQYPDTFDKAVKYYGLPSERNGS